MKNFLLLPLIILSAFLISACAEEDTILSGNPTVWDGTTSIEPEISSDDTYLIDNASNLAWFDNKSLTKNAILTNDIDMGNHTFTGIDNITGDITLDGDNHSISNLKLADTVREYDGVGLIQEVGAGDNLIIKNLRLINGTVNPSKESMFGASFVADVAGGNVTLDNVLSNLTVYATHNAGGLIGNIVGASESIVIKKSINKGKVVTKGDHELGSHAGGLIGGMSSSHATSRLTIDNSSNEGVIESGIGYMHYQTAAGGLVGNVVTIDRINIAYSYNKATITANESGGAAGLIGGISGSAQKVNIDKSYNKGAIISNGGAGGFIASNNNTIETTITNSFNSGDVEGTFGIGGFLGGTSGPDIKSSYNSGKITTKAPIPAYDNSTTGGLIGSVWMNDVTIADSYNTGVIVSYSIDYNSYSGGLIGKAQASTFPTPTPFNVSITTSYSYADMIAETDNSTNTPQTSAIIGWQDTGYVTVTSTATDNFYYSKVGLTDGSHATLKSDVDFKDKTTFGDNWDFDNTWDMIEGNLYPTLRNVVKPND